MDASDTGDADADVSALAGMWYMDGDVNAASWIELDGSGIWTLYERSAEGDWSEVDYGDAPRERRQPIRGGIRRV